MNALSFAVGDYSSRISDISVLGPDLLQWISTPSFRTNHFNHINGVLPIEVRGNNNHQFIIRPQGIISLAHGTVPNGVSPIDWQFTKMIEVIQELANGGLAQRIEVGGPTEFRAPDIPFTSMKMPCIPPPINFAEDPPFVDNPYDWVPILEAEPLPFAQYTSRKLRTQLSRLAVIANTAVLGCYFNHPNGQSCVADLASFVESLVKYIETGGHTNIGVVGMDTPEKVEAVKAAFCGCARNSVPVSMLPQFDRICGVPVPNPSPGPNPGPGPAPGPSPGPVNPPAGSLIEKLCVAMQAAGMSKIQILNKQFDCSELVAMWNSGELFINSDACPSGFVTQPVQIPIANASFSVCIKESAVIDEIVNQNLPLIAAVVVLIGGLVMMRL